MFIKLIVLGDWCYKMLLELPLYSKFLTLEVDVLDNSLLLRSPNVDFSVVYPPLAEITLEDDWLSYKQ